MKPNFPIFVRTRDSGEIFYANSIQEIQYHLERVDVEDGEFEAWDATGVPMRLLAHEPIWLDIEPLDNNTKQMSLKDAISDFAARKNVISSETTVEYTKAVDQIETESMSKRRRGIFARLRKP